jgi:hypothetical protein
MRHTERDQSAIQYLKSLHLKSLLMIGPTIIPVVL